MRRILNVSQEESSSSAWQLAYEQSRFSSRGFAGLDLTRAVDRNAPAFVSSTATFVKRASFLFPSWSGDLSQSVTLGHPNANPTLSTELAEALNTIRDNRIAAKKEENSLTYPSEASHLLTCETTQRLLTALATERHWQDFAGGLVNAADKDRIRNLQADGGMEVINTIPSVRQFAMPTNDFRNCVRWKLGLHLQLGLREGTKCPCGEPASVPHFLICKIFGLIIHAHNSVAAVFASLCRALSAYVDQPTSLIPGTNLRPDGLSYSLELSEGQSATAFDVAIVSPNEQSLGAAKKMEAIKIRKYWELLLLNIRFVPLVMEQTGGFGPSMQSFFRTAGGLIENNGGLVGQTWANQTVAAYFKQRVAVACASSLMRNLRILTACANTGTRPDLSIISRYSRAGKAKHVFRDY